MLTPKAHKQVLAWLELPHEIIVEYTNTPRGIVWGRMLSTPPTSGSVCAPSQVEVATQCMHTHPRACYDRNGTYYGWPSGNDYATFLEQSGNEHLVCTLEGIYMIKSTPSAVSTWKRLSNKEQDAYIKAWDLASTSREFTPQDALRALYPKLKGWMDVSLHNYE
jgi:hypothetical protein